MTNPYGDYGNQPHNPQQNNAVNQPNYGQPNSVQGNQPYGSPSYPQYDAGNTYAHSAQYGFDGGMNNGLSRPRPQVGFGQAVRNYFKYMFRFSGRASRSEFWWVQLFWFIIFAVVVGIGAVASIGLGSALPAESTSDLSGSEIGFLVSFLGTCFGILILALVQFVTTLGLNWRRVQDTGVHGAVSLIGLTGLPIMLVFGFIPPSPKGYQYDAPSDYDRP